MTNAWFISVWDDGIEIGTRCWIDDSSNEIHHNEAVRVNGVEHLDREYVELDDGKTFPAVCENEYEEMIDEYGNPPKNVFWYS